MKKLFTIFTVVILTTTMSLAQDLTSKKGENYLPESDEWSIGYDATSLLQYFGNFIGNTTPNAAPTVGSPYSTYPAAFYGKKVIDENSAWRVRVQFSSFSNSISTSNEITYFNHNYSNIIEQIVDPGGVVLQNGSFDWDFTTEEETADDKVTNSGFDFSVLFGKEFRRGSTRLQGIYGAEGGLGFSSAKTTYEYGHSASLMFREEFAASEGPFGSLDGLQSTRILEEKLGSVFGLGARIFIGAEYFILPKMSLGVEYGWTLALSTSGESSVTTETTEAIETIRDWAASGWGDVKVAVDQYDTNSETVSGGSSSGGFGVGNDLRGSIILNFYF